MKNYDHTSKKKTFCVKHNKKCKPITGSWILRENGWECSEVNIPFPEMVPQRIHDDRVKYANDQLQSHRGGELSKEFLEAYPDRAKKMIKDGAITKDEVKRAKNVWQEVKGVTKKADIGSLIKDN